MNRKLSCLIFSCLLGSLRFNHSVLTEFQFLSYLNTGWHREKLVKKTFSFKETYIAICYWEHWFRIFMHQIKADDLGRSLIWFLIKFKINLMNLKWITNNCHWRGEKVTEMETLTMLWNDWNKFHEDRNFVYFVHCCILSTRIFLVICEHITIFVECFWVK